MEITIKSLKDKIMKSIDEIDISKLSIYELKELSGTIKTISEIDETHISYADLMLKLTSSSGFNSNKTTLSDLKGDVE